MEIKNVFERDTGQWMYQIELVYHKYPMVADWTINMSPSRYKLFYADVLDSSTHKADNGLAYKVLYGR